MFNIGLMLKLELFEKNNSESRINILYSNHEVKWLHF
jgi:hypothetical protein